MSTAALTRTAGLRGRKSSFTPRGVGSLRHYLTSPLPTPPASFDYAPAVEGGFPMALNDQLGDCTIAGVVHLLQLAYACVGKQFTVPSTDEIREVYFGLTGGADTGLVETTVLKAWSAPKGLFGTQLIGWAPIDVRDDPLLAAACYSFGGLYLGGDMPAALPEQQFEQHQWWSLEPGVHPAADGHCFVGSGVTPAGMPDITWGGEDGFSWPWWRYYGATAYVTVPNVFEEVGHGPLASIDINTLRSDLASV